MKLFSKETSINVKIKEPPTTMKKISRSFNVRGKSQVKVPLREKNNVNIYSKQREASTQKLINKNHALIPRAPQRKRNSSELKYEAIMDEVLDTREQRLHPHLPDVSVAELHKVKRELEEKMNKIDNKIKEIADVSP